MPLRKAYQSKHIFKPNSQLTRGNPWAARANAMRHRARAGRRSADLLTGSTSEGVRLNSYLI
eukprot:724905-Prorocentrum_minimum.AAC.2